MAWLAAHAKDKPEHDANKTEFNLVSSYAVRQKGRQLFKGMAKSKDGLYKAKLEHEARLRGVDEEPKSL